MDFDFEGRPGESHWVDTFWRTQSDQAGTFMSSAGTNWEMVVACFDGQTTVTLRGPETKARIADCPADAAFFGIRFKFGTFMPQLPTNDLADSERFLHDDTGRKLWLHGTTWEVPTYDNADVFVARLGREGLLAQEPLVDTVLHKRAPDLSARSVQRRFLRATGMTQGTFDQIQRAQQAAALLAQGVAILDAVDACGYADQPHLTRSLKRYLGHTPAQLLRSPTPDEAQVARPPAAAV